MNDQPTKRDRARTLAQVERDADGCRRCDLYKHATQTVFGAGPVGAKLMLVGEQPGDQEDKAGEPFVGPAGTLLREALVEAGIPIAAVYLTNAVKHFKWKPAGKRRLHERPNREEILACRLWFDDEVRLVKPGAIIALGATAASVVLGSGPKVLRDRGKLFPSPLAPIVTLTVHPSSILRAPDAAARATARRLFVRDLAAIAKRQFPGR
ncbi:MAG TPA: UdgX family uracil-DNA binding protein [Vicinamibacterales bacterium]|nr:UdgX family uracil-DNA binding protein [Vicinamibacterales bacterium]